jgi:hypothetical protein
MQREREKASTSIAKGGFNIKKLPKATCPLNIIKVITYLPNGQRYEREYVSDDDSPPSNHELEDLARSQELGSYNKTS